MVISFRFYAGFDSVGTLIVLPWGILLALDGEYFRPSTVSGIYYYTDTD
ncbi:MAG: hypothetical protein NTV54_15425 [Ignavibacteriales bacterium]|nr:hypothetical protein [Ignavibacteriales bacterium]